MTAEEFTAFCDEMQAKGLAKSITAIAYSLGVEVTTIYNLRKRGADRRTALACAALLAGLTEYGAKK